MNTHDVLRSLVERATCKPTWRYTLEKNKDGFLELVIFVTGPDSRSPEFSTTIHHHFLVPEATYNEESWRRWMFECSRKVEDHELGEWFMIDHKRPFAPLHGEGEDPYAVHEIRSETAARTNQDGSTLFKGQL